MSREEHSTAVVPASPQDLAIVASDAPEEDALIGTTLHDTYNVVRFLAEGGMGRVYEAQHTRIATKRFAIKVLHSDLKHSMDVRMRFRREAEAAAAVEHPNVVGVHDFGYTPDGRPYLVSDYLDGQELHALLATYTPLPVRMAARIGCQLCRALEAAHDKGVIHRDLKPANVFLIGPKDAPEVRVLDFGLSKILELADATDTQTGTVMGTPSYMAPEQAKGERADHRADIYGVGAVLYACLTGRPPFEEESPHQTVLAVMTREPVRPCLIVPSIPPDLEVIVQKAMAHNPADRYATMNDLEAALAPFALEVPTLAKRGTLPSVVTDLTPTGPTANAGIAEARGVRRRAMGWLILTALLLLVGGLSAAIGGFPLVWKSNVSSTELILLSLGVVGSLFTPCLLLLLWLRRRYWNNSARMVNLVANLRSPIIAACAVYGLAALLGRVLDAASLYVREPGPAPNASGWLGWAPFLFALGVMTAIGTVLRRIVLATSQSLARRVLAGPLLISAVSAASCVLLITGYRLSVASDMKAPAIVAEAPAEAHPAPSNTAAAAAPATTAPAEPVRTAAPTAEPTTAPPQAPAAEADRAPDADIDKAVAGGVGPLTELQTRYPKDPRVLVPLAKALMKDPSRSSELLRVLDSLFTVAPEQAADADLMAAMRAAALAPATSQRAMEIMKGSMGAKGADILFDLVMTEPTVRAKARAMLETPEVQRSLSPALTIAYDLFTAPTCQARASLLDQAVRDGDERSVTVLNLFTQRTAKGCGPKKNKSCPAICDKEVPAFEKAMQQIQDKAAAEKK